MKFLLFLFALFALPVMGQSPVLFEEGNEAYNNGNYSEAIDKYEQILNSGETSAELYFNLGNAHYRLNNIAPSIYYYEKALQLNPNDGDVKNNLEFARNMVLDDIQETKRSGFSAFWREAISILGYNEWAWLAISFSALFAISFLIYYFSRRSFHKRLFFTVSMVVLAGLFLSLIFAFQQRNLMTGDQYAIIFSEEAEAKSEPTPRSEEVFRLHEGTKVQVLETYQEWVKFELANGLQGWMDKSNMKFL